MYRNTRCFYLMFVSFEVLGCISKGFPKSKLTAPQNGLKSSKLKSCTVCSKWPCGCYRMGSHNKMSCCSSCYRKQHCKLYNKLNIFVATVTFSTACDVVSKAVGETSSINIWIKACIILGEINLMWMCVCCSLDYVLFNRQKDLCKCTESGRKDYEKKLQS